ncbi:MAG: AAC(3) family N-acetyltransferase [Clostridia bacterium]|nr:AAC(3) family N-acetyltransferase [Clostridia bacterium]
MPSERKLFEDADKICYTDADVLSRLKAVGAHDCDMLFVHTDIMFGIPNRDMKRREYLDALSEVLLSLNVPTLLLPTFTFSFPNHEVYDVRSSKTSMGVLLEHMRKRSEVVYRTLDPLLAVSVIGRGAGAFYDLGRDSLGENSAFDRVHQNGGAKFLIFGGELGESLTYVHHVEKMLDVPYRYDQPFTGRVIDADGREYETTQSIHTACGGVQPCNFYHFEEDLADRGLLRRERLGDSKVICVEEAVVYREVAAKLAQNMSYFLGQPFTEADLRHEYKYGRNGEKVTHC